MLNEIGSGSLKSRCLAACSDNWALDKLTSHLENPNHAPMKLYDNLELKMKVQLLESSLVGARKLMEEKEKERGDRSERDRDAELSEKMMYEEGEGSAAKAVVLGCGVAPANGIYAQKGDNNPGAGNAAPGRRDPNEIISYEKEACGRGSASRLHYTRPPRGSTTHSTNWRCARTTIPTLRGGYCTIRRRSWARPATSSAALNEVELLLIETCLTMSPRVNPNSCHELLGNETLERKWFPLYISYSSEYFLASRFIPSNKLPINVFVLCYSKTL